MSKTQGDILRELRLEKDITQEDLGKALNVSKQTVNNWENNRRKCDSDTLFKLAKFFDVTVDYLLGINENKKPIEDLTEKQKQALILADQLSDEEFDNIIRLVISMKRGT